MENETLEEQTRNLANRLIESLGSQIHFKRDDEPSVELQHSVVRNLCGLGYRAEFYRYGNEPLGISLSEIEDDEEDEKIYNGY